jgi:hypothetical protein
MVYTYNKPTLTNMTLAEKNALVHTRLMRRTLDVVCSGPTVEHPDTPHEWRCRACGKTGVWGESTTHMMQPPNYFEDMNAIMQLFDNQGAMVGTRIELWRGTRYAARICEYPGPFNMTIDFSTRCQADALCRAALLAAGIVDEIGVVQDEVQTS